MRSSTFEADTATAVRGATFGPSSIATAQHNTETQQRPTKDGVVAIIAEDVFGDRRDLVITHELYTLAARDPAYRDITTAWMARSRSALERWFDPGTTRFLDALIEGLTIHRALDTEPSAALDIRSTVERLVRSD